MTAKLVKSTARHARQLIEDIRAVQQEAVGEHLTDDQFVSYSMDPPELEPEMLLEVEQHLTSCTECAGRMEHLLSVSEAWRGPEGEMRLARVSKRIRDRFVGASSPVANVAAAVGSIARLADWLRQLPQYPAALGALAGASVAERSPAESEHLLIREDGEGNLQIRISSYDLSLAGTFVVVEPFDQLLTLGQVAPDQVGAAAVIPYAARINLAPGTVVRWRVEGL